MPRDAKDVKSSLTKKGFRLREGKDSYFHLFVDGAKTPVWTKVSHGEKEIHDGLLSAMARQMRLSKRQLGDFVDCPLSEEEYVRFLREANQIS
jgi:predicted RNA binding protein YcfA (HicA-like mRNA interferase family)